MRLQETTNIKMLLSCSCLLSLFCINWGYFFSHLITHLYLFGPILVNWAGQLITPDGVFRIASPYASALLNPQPTAQPVCLAIETKLFFSGLDKDEIESRIRRRQFIVFIKVFSGKLGFFLCRLNVHLSTRFIYMSIVYTLLSQISYNLRLLSQKLGNLESTKINQNQLKLTFIQGISPKSSGIPQGREGSYLYFYREGQTHTSFLLLL